MGLKPVVGSTPLTRSIIGRLSEVGMDVNGPASPSMSFSISALQGQTVTHWPQDTQLDSLIGRSLPHTTRGLSRSQSMLSVALPSTSWHASTQRPHKRH